MIPAILSVVFVIYLYQSLKETSASPAGQATGEPSEVQANELVARLRSLQARVGQLASGNQNQGNAR
jgi:hypothetical protein